MIHLHLINNIMKVVTVTVNPVLDTSTIADLVVPLKKTRCKSPVHEPGGGGINVSRALKKLGCDSIAIIMTGGENGKIIQQLLNDEGINIKVVETEGNTRENILVYEEKTGEHYRFVMPGPRMQRRSGRTFWKPLRI
jgi:6-phosphofructokinase 2